MKEIVKRLTPTKKTLVNLFARTGNQCAFTGCSTTFTNPENDTNLSNICHIAGAEKGGERYDPNMTDKEREKKLTTYHTKTL